MLCLETLKKNNFLLSQMIEQNNINTPHFFENMKQKNEPTYSLYMGFLKTSSEKLKFLQRMKNSNIPTKKRTVLKVYFSLIPSGSYQEFYNSHVKMMSLTQTDVLQLSETLCNKYHLLDVICDHIDEINKEIYESISELSHMLLDVHSNVCNGIVLNRFSPQSSVLIKIEESYGKMKKFKKRIQGHDIIVDFCNIIYSHKDTQKQSFKRIGRLIEHLKLLGYNPLIVVQQGYGKIIKNQWKQHVYVCPNMNDDIYIIYASILLKSNYVTNDQFRDHIFKLGLDQKYIDGYMVTYKEVSGNPVLKFPLEFEKTAQKIKNILYIPYEGKMIVIE
jgi:hypothetical protein